jgi:hypothetical protein
LVDLRRSARRRKAEHYAAKHFGFGSPETSLNNP